MCWHDLRQRQQQHSSITTLQQHLDSCAAATTWLKVSNGLDLHGLSTPPHDAVLDGQLLEHWPVSAGNLAKLLSQIQT
jgi:hypothetical protein